MPISIDDKGKTCVFSKKGGVWGFEPEISQKTLREFCVHVSDSTGNKRRKRVFLGVFRVSYVIRTEKHLKKQRKKRVFRTFAKNTQKHAILVCFLRVFSEKHDFFSLRHL
jgi:hypothetical protein